MKDIIQVIQEKRENLERIQTELEALEQARRIMERGGRPGRRAAVKKKVRRAVRRGRRRRKQLSIPDAAEQVLRQNGKPLHAREIAKRIKDIGVDTTAHNVATSLQRYVYKKKRFKRTAPGTFGVA